MYYVGNIYEFAAVAISFIIGFFVLLLLKKTILKNDDIRKRGFTPRRLLAFIIAMLSITVPLLILWHFLVGPVWW